MPPFTPSVSPRSWYGPHFKVISASDNASASFDYGLGNAIVENPLVDAVNGLDAHSNYSLSVLKSKGRMTNSNEVPPYPEDLDTAVTAQHRKFPSRYTAKGIIADLESASVYISNSSKLAVPAPHMRLLYTTRSGLHLL